VSFLITWCRCVVGMKVAVVGDIVSRHGFTRVRTNVINKPATMTRISLRMNARMASRRYTSRCPPGDGPTRTRSAADGIGSTRSASAKGD
jgi:hypothetical protein